MRGLLACSNIEGNKNIYFCIIHVNTLCELCAYCKYIKLSSFPFGSVILSSVNILLINHHSNVFTRIFLKHVHFHCTLIYCIYSLIFCSFVSPLLINSSDK